LPPRSRKRGQRSRRPEGTAAPEAPGPRPGFPAPEDGAPSPAVPHRSRSEERNAAVRATLTPLAPGERPWAVRIAAGLALFIGAGDLVEVVAGGKVKFGSAHPGIGGIVAFSVVMLVCAVGMWQLRYWAVLGFQAILALVILVFSLLLIRASNLLGVIVALAVIGGGGWLFFKLVRVLSRLQLPRQPRSD